MEEVEKAKKEAIKQLGKEDAVDTELENTKQAALKKINTLNLKEQKAVFVKQVNEAKTVADVEKVLAQAQMVSDQHDKEDATMGNKEAFIQRKITVLNTKGSSKFERLAQRVILNNR